MNYGNDGPHKLHLTDHERQALNDMLDYAYLKLSEELTHAENTHKYSRSYRLLDIEHENWTHVLLKIKEALELPIDETE